MNLLLVREPSRDSATLGELFLNGKHECWTCEDQLREIPGRPVSEWKIPGKTAIPAGTYDLTIDFSQRFQRLMIHVLDVPGFSGIRVHTGNTAADTEGCILVGREKGDARVIQSGLALADLQPKIQAALDRGEEVLLEIRNPV